MPDAAQDATVVQSKVPEPSHPERIDSYELVKVLGKGGMGTVYLARDHALDRLVAIKMLLPFSTDTDNEERRQLLTRFLREAKAIACLNHRNIVSIHGIGKKPGSIYIVMEYVEGQTLSELIRTAPQLSYSSKLGYMIQMCEGLAVIHRAGFVHRDIKPGNIMLTHDDVIKIMDFGTVHTTESELTRKEQIIGTPSYMSPEQIQGRDLDQRSDIFALGSVFYQFLTGEKPFSGTSFSSVSYKITHETPSPPSRLDPLLPKAVDRVILKMLEKSPDSRYGTCELLVRDLQALLDRRRLNGRTVWRGMFVASGVLLLLGMVLVAYLVFGTNGELGAGRLWRQLREFAGKSAGEQLAEPARGSAPFRQPVSLEFLVAYQPADTTEVRRLRNLEALSSRDRFRIVFCPREPCFVHVFRIDNGVDVIPLYPLTLHTSLPAGKRIVLPEGPEPYALADLRGEQQIVVVASTSRSLDLDSKAKVLAEAQRRGDLKLEKIYKFKLRLALNRSVVETVDTALTATIPWDSSGLDYTYTVRRADDLCEECALRVAFTVNP